MGVSGAGKSTVGRLIAARLDCPFRDADSFHPPANIEKMSRGEPLTDEDRWPWLDAIAAWIAEHRAAGTSLRRHLLGAQARLSRHRHDGQRADVRLVYLKGDFDLIAARLAARKGHFMPPALLREPVRRAGGAARRRAPGDRRRGHVAAARGRYHPRAVGPRGSPGGDLTWRPVGSFAEFLQDQLRRSAMSRCGACSAAPGSIATADVRAGVGRHALFPGGRRQPRRLRGGGAGALQLRRQGQDDRAAVLARCPSGCSTSPRRWSTGRGPRLRRRGGWRRQRSRRRSVADADVSPRRR